MTQEQFKACIDRICNGDKNGLKEIYDEYLGVIYTTIYGIVNQKENAEDLTQEFFLKVYQMASSMEMKDSHKTYLVTIAKNMAIDFIRKNNKESLVEDFSEAGTIPVSPDKPEDEVIADITLKEALASLTEKERQVVSMKILSEMTFQEIAEILNTPLGTITWRYQEAIKKLRRLGYE